jgi:UDP-2-acetamido-3-amino-2,3-dideoxy-glucuronate N-acetyltransferase
MKKADSRGKKDRPGIFIHGSACVDDGAKIGDGTRIWHFTHVMSGARIGKNCRIGQNCFVGSRAVLKDGVKLQNNVSVYDLITLEEDVFVGPSAVFTNDLNPRAAYPKGGKWIPTLVKRGASIGANATVLCGIMLGSNCLVGAGAVVTKDVPDYAVVVGNPASVAGWMCECGGKLEFAGRGAKAICKKCNRVYRKSGTAVREVQ